jgi:hypothetical protein
VNEDFKIDLAGCRVTHLPTGCAYSFPEPGQSGDLQLWQVVEIGRRGRDIPDQVEIRRMAFELYLAAARRGDPPPSC